MAQRTVVLLEDDLVGGEATETVRFGLDGVNYEIDLNEENAKSLRSDMEKWVNGGRRVAAGRAVAPRARARRGGETSKVRAWAKENGIEVSERGRISATVQEAYDAAH